MHKRFHSDKNSFRGTQIILKNKINFNENNFITTQVPTKKKKKNLYSVSKLYKFGG